MRKFLVLTGFILLLAGLGAGGWWAWPILFPPGSPGWLSTLAKADAALLQNRPDLARLELKQPPEGLPVTGWLQWEKRVHAVAVATGAWDWASTVATIGQAKYPGNPDLSAYLVWTLIKDHRPKEASTLAEKVLVGTSWNGLAVQARVEAQGVAQDDWSSLRESLSSPSQVSYELYNRLNTLDSDPSLRKNALLSALSQGRLDDARVHLGVLTPAQRDQPPFDRLQALLAYDQGDWSRAAALLRSLVTNRPENLLVLADVYLHLGDPSQARLIYDQMLADNPSNFPLSLGINRATLALDDADPAKALDLLARVIQDHPKEGASKARLLVLEARFHLGEVQAVRESLDKIIQSGQESDLALDAELLKGRLFPEWTSVPRLWSLLHRHPEFPPLAERLTWVLLNDEDYQGAHRVLAIHETALQKSGQAPSWWAHFLSGLLHAVENRLVLASESFEKVPPAWRDAAFYADWAMVPVILSQQSEQEQRKPLLETGLERQNRALELLPPSQDPPALQRRSRWLTRRGEWTTALVPLVLPHLRGALKAEASDDFRQALQLDPDNLRASFLMRQSEATNQEKP